VEQQPQQRNGSLPDSEASSGNEPVTIGTLFILIVFLMALAGLWGIMYFTLLGR